MLLLDNIFCTSSSSFWHLSVAIFFSRMYHTEAPFPVVHQKILWQPETAGKISGWNMATATSVIVLKDKEETAFPPLVDCWLSQHQIDFHYGTMYTMNHWEVANVTQPG